MQSRSIKQELHVLDSLLRDEAFALVIAGSLHASYYKGLKKTPPPFLLREDETTTIKVSTKDENIAISLASFYALECGLGALCAQTNDLPFKWIERFADSAANSGAVLLLNRFANATWKAGQPFQSLNRISRKNFKSADALDAEEVEEYATQIKNAAAKLLVSLQPVKNGTLHEQMLALRGLLQNTTYAEEMARHLHATYALRQGGTSTPPLETDKPLVKTEKQLKIATNLAGFYAMECAVNYLATTENILPSALLQDLINQTLPKENENLFARFANATWKAGQPFRGFERITRPVFVPFYFLSEADIEKDLVQVRTAAQLVLPLLAQRTNP